MMRYHDHDYVRLYGTRDYIEVLKFTNQLITEIV